MLEEVMRTAAFVLGAGALLSFGCGNCEPPVAGVLTNDLLPAVVPTGSTERIHTLVAPRSGDLDITFERQDGLSSYAGSVYLFVTGPECVHVSNDPQRMNNGQAFRPECAVLANSYAAGPTCLGCASLAAPAHVERGQTVKVFVYGLSTPADLPYRLAYTVGDDGCTSGMNGP
jgi:hypothetical protein